MPEPIRPSPTSPRSDQPRQRTDRKVQIARAALDVIAQEGLVELTHRRVAAEAGVSLGATTYHYSTIDELMRAALILALEENRARLAEWLAPMREVGDIPDVLTNVVVESVTRSRVESSVANELYLVSIRRVSLSPIARAWAAELEDHLGRLVDLETARSLAAYVDGLLLHALTRLVPLHRDHIRAMIARMLER